MTAFVGNLFYVIFEKNLIFLWFGLSSAQTRMMQESGDMLHPDRFGLLLRKAASMGDVRDCPVRINRTDDKIR